MSDQFRGYFATNQPVHLIVNRDTIISQPLRDNVTKSGGSIRIYDQHKGRIF